MVIQTRIAIDIPCREEHGGPIAKSVGKPPLMHENATDVGFRQSAKVASAVVFRGPASKSRAHWA
jgi:hypothetical protein